MLIVADRTVRCQPKTIQCITAFSFGRNTDLSFCFARCYPEMAFVLIRLAIVATHDIFLLATFLRADARGSEAISLALCIVPAFL